MKKHWLKILLFGGIATALVVCCTPDFTWAGQNQDLFDFIYSSTFFNVAHAPGIPLYVMLGYLVTRLPFNPAWSLAFSLSVIPTLITCGLIFFIIVHKTTNKLLPYLGTLAFAGSQLVFSQAIMPEIYALQTMLLVLTYVLFELDKKKLAMLSLGFAVCVSWGALILVPIFVWKYLVPSLKALRANIKTIAYGLIPLLLYAYIPLVNRPPYMSLGPTSLEAFKAYYLQHPSAIMNLAVWELPTRIVDGFAIILGSLGITAILIAYCLAKKENRTLLWLAASGIIFYLTTRGPDGFVQMIPSFAFLSIALYALDLRQAITFKRLKLLGALAMPKWRIAIRPLAYGALGCSILFLGLNTHFYDIGRTLDPAPTSAQQFYTQLDEVKDREVVVVWDALAYAGVHYYNEKNNRNLCVIHPIFYDLEGVPSWEYRYGLNYEYGQTKYELPESSDDWSNDYNKLVVVTTEEFAEANPDRVIWYTVAGTERSRRSVDLTRVGDEFTFNSVEGVTTRWYEYALIYPYAQKLISGYYNMSPKWTTGIETNWTAGLLFGLLALGAFTGLLGDRVLYRKYKPRRRQLMTFMTTVMTVMIFILVLAYMGMEGVRFVP